MSNILYLDYLKSIDKENVMNLIKIIEGLCENTEYPMIFLYFSTDGGEVDACEILIDYFNTCNKNIILIPIGNISSAGFDIVIRSKIVKRIIYDCFACVHLSNDEIFTRDLKNNSSYSTMKEAKMYQLNANEYKFFRSLGIFTRKELLEIKHGNDIWIHTDRIVKAIENYGGKVLIEKTEYIDDVQNC
jgi:hypothetical protein